jgi:xanthine dehydrogenase small subunit
MRDHVTFHLNGRPTQLAGASALTTVLRHLREERRMVGTKEGCAEGDCGACSIVVARLEQGKVTWRAMNACIMFTPQIDGADVTTVEGIAGPDGELHPCQQALVAAHGSQCGFCTPGFVLSMYALYRTCVAAGTRPDRGMVDRWLAGNLCRCTGYSPIAAAALKMFELPRPAWDVARVEAERARLLSSPEMSLMVAYGERRAFRPTTLHDLAEITAAHPDATIVSGSTDAGLWLTKKLQPLPQRIFTGGVRDGGFTDIRRQGRQVTIGAGVTHAQAMSAQLHPALTELWRRFAGEQVRNAGTVGGNIANGSPIGDLAPALLTLDATLQLRLGAATRELPLDAFFIAYGRQDRRPGEILTAVSFELPVHEIDLSIHKVSKRFDDDISAVCGAFHLPVVAGMISNPRIAFGGMAATPKRARAVEAALNGKAFTRQTIEDALPHFAADFQPIDDMRASAGYRMTVARNLLRRVYVERAEPQSQTQLVGQRAAFVEAAS